MRAMGVLMLAPSRKLRHVGGENRLCDVLSKARSDVHARIQRENERWAISKSEGEDRARNWIQSVAH
ncbi:hypothetical protein C8Q77DRAFT_474294 [Trametes polyzona]|nr:hypothetical protein C8Q77DRAFT_474294 [Trametes polyzona]